MKRNPSYRVFTVQRVGDARNVMLEPEIIVMQNSAVYANNQLYVHEYLVPVPSPTTQASSQ